VAFVLLGGTRGEAGAARDDGSAHGEEEPHPVRDGARPDSLPALITEARRRRRRSRWWAAAGLAAAAAVLAVLALIVPAALVPEGPHPQAVSMQQVEPSPLAATVRLVDESWGTRIDMSCSYAKESGAEAGRAWSYVLVVTDSSGRQTPVSTWTASAGTTVEPVATVGVPRDRIRSLEVRAADGTVLLRSRFG
jgi:hypothetical protein